jgi:cell division protein FtsI (penicillin-binding protein 3)
MLTISYGHGLSASPLHLARAYATITNGGVRVRPTLVKRQGMEPAQTGDLAPHLGHRRDMLRKTVTEGTASFGDVAGYEVAARPAPPTSPSGPGGYYDDKVITTFAASSRPRPEYVLVVTLDEPEDRMGDRTAPHRRLDGRAGGRRDDPARRAPHGPRAVH